MGDPPDGGDSGVVDADTPSRDARPDGGDGDADDGGSSDDGGGDSGNDASHGDRVTLGLLALYTFDEGSGDRVSDISGAGDPIDLVVGDPGAVAWGAGTLSVESPTIVASPSPASRIVRACQISGAITLEGWITPASTAAIPDTTPPARILTISQDSSLRNVTLAQGASDTSEGDHPDAYSLRARTTETSDNGLPGNTTPDGLVRLELTHVVATVTAPGERVIYVNGEEVVRGALAGSFDVWTDMPLALANEQSGARQWLGTYHLLAVYARALTAAQVRQNYRAGAGD